MRKKIIPVILLSALCTGGSSKAEEMDVRIEGEARSDLEISRPGSEVQVELEEFVRDYTDKLDSLLESEAGIGISGEEPFARNPGGYLPSLHTRGIPEPPLLTFFPASENRKDDWFGARGYESYLKSSRKFIDVSVFDPIDLVYERWELAIIDDKGEVVKNYSGNGKFDTVIEWDGTDKKGKMAQPGRDYSYKFVIFDKPESRFTVVDEAFRLNSVKYFSDGVLYVEICNEFLYESNSEALSPHAENALNKLVDCIAEYSSFQSRLLISSGRTPETLAGRRIERVREYVLSALPLTEDSLETSVSRSNERGNVTILIIKLTGSK